MPRLGGVTAAVAGAAVVDIEVLSPLASGERPRRPSLSARHPLQSAWPVFYGHKHVRRSQATIGCYFVRSGQTRWRANGGVLFMGRPP